MCSIVFQRTDTITWRILPLYKPSWSAAADLNLSRFENSCVCADGVRNAVVSRNNSLGSMVLRELNQLL